MCIRDRYRVEKTQVSRGTIYLALAFASHHGPVNLRHCVVQAQLAQLQRKVDKLASLFSDKVADHVRVSAGGRNARGWAARRRRGKGQAA